MKIFCFDDDTDFIVAAENEYDAVRFHNHYYNDYHSTVEEVPLTNCMWYTMERTENIMPILLNNPEKEYTIKKDWRKPFCFAIRLTFEEKIEYDNIKEPYLIYSTEH